MWNKLNPKQKKILIFIFVLILSFLLFYQIYGVLFRDSKPVQDKRSNKDSIIDTKEERNMLEKSVINDLNSTISDLKKKNEELNQKITEQNNVINELKQEKLVKQPNSTADSSVFPVVPPPPPSLPPSTITPSRTVTAGDNIDEVKQIYPPQPEINKDNDINSRGNKPIYPPQPEINKSKGIGNKDNINEKDGKSNIMGGYLTVIANPQKSDQKDADNKSNDNKKIKAYIPSGTFMKAHVLLGAFAPTVKTGNISAAPMLFRIQTPAQLPNEIKKNLKGCFITGAAEGSLQDQRAHVTTEFISCVTKGGKSVIDQEIKGYVADTDGSNGVRGRVVAKLSEPLRNSIIVGMLSGVGEVLKSSSLVYNISGLGQSQSLDPTKLQNAAIGGAIIGATDKLKDFYLKLSESSMPVIETGTGFDVTIVVQKGVELNIKPFCEDKECDN